MQHLPFVRSWISASLSTNSRNVNLRLGKNKRLSRSKKLSSALHRKSIGAVLESKGAEKIRNVCLDIDHSDMVEGGETLLLDGAEIGIINSPCYSHRLNKSLALAHIDPSISVGTILSVIGDGIDTTAKVVASPVYDPKKLQTHS